ncbi:MAG: hypothetical protein JSW27_04580 [Phycisphaerales bacterium]|nr:MAG: hypothetical protein JSW27_04580 [Phycisphaerales bacterium]
MGKNKKPIRHMGMTMTEEEHRKWHAEHEGKELTEAEHRQLMEHMGISEEEDRQWHEAQQSSREDRADDSAPPGDPVNPFAIGGAFLQYCVRQGWLIQQGRGRAMKYYVTKAGRAALAEYGITKY